MSKNNEIAGLVQVYMDQAYNPLTLQPCAVALGEPVITTLRARTMGEQQELIVIDPTGMKLTEIEDTLIGPGKRYENRMQMQRAAINGAPNAFVRGRVINDDVKPVAGDLTALFCRALLATLPESFKKDATIVVAEELLPLSKHLPLPANGPDRFIS